VAYIRAFVRLRRQLCCAPDVALAWAWVTLAGRRLAFSSSGNWLPSSHAVLEALGPTQVTAHVRSFLVALKRHLHDQQHDQPVPYGKSTHLV
jgi:hypothetical protein